MSEPPEIASWADSDAVPAEDATMPGADTFALPLAGSQRRERADAVRNRAAVLRAASMLFARDGVQAVDVRDIARCAGVGVGTVYRRFGDKGSLIAAILGDSERDLQDRLLTGPPPLGPGAPPAERLVAFLHALTDLTEVNIDLLVLSESSATGARFRVGAYQAWRLHTRILLEGIDPALDASWFADLLLAPLAADLYQHQRSDLGTAVAQIKANLHTAVNVLAHRGGESSTDR